jgi:probable HAF family extracellular repeat protein
MRTAWLVLGVVAAVGCGNDRQLTQPAAAATVMSAVVTDTPHYVIEKLPILAGTTQGAGINNRGWVAGYSVSSDGLRHAVLWRDDVPTDLGQAGLISLPQWPGISSAGVVVGISQMPTADTLGESWSCAAFMGASGKVCLGFAWYGDALHALPAWGGENGFATGVNSRGDVVGWAETAVHDPTCHTPQVLQFRATVWSIKDGSRRQLRPFPGDSTSAATATNSRGQVVGISGDCDVAVGRKSARHAVLWDGDQVIDLGDLHGQYWNTPMALNQDGTMIVGFANPPDGDLDGDSLRAFVWTRGSGMKDLGRLAGDDRPRDGQAGRLCRHTHQHALRG